MRALKLLLIIATIYILDRKNLLPFKITIKRIIFAFLSAFLLGIGYFIYDGELRETTLATSTSPNQENKIKVVEKGAAFFFGPSKVRIKSGWRHHTDRIIGNDGARLNSSNVSIEWRSEDIAIITLEGNEQYPELVEFDAKKEKFKTISESGT